jgi:hypothetical protein
MLSPAVGGIAEGRTDGPWEKSSMTFFHFGYPKKAGVFRVGRRRIQRRVTLATAS